MILQLQNYSQYNLKQDGADLGNSWLKLEMELGFTSFKIKGIVSKNLGWIRNFSLNFR